MPLLYLSKTDVVGFIVNFWKANSIPINHNSWSFIDLKFHSNVPYTCAGIKFQMESYKWDASHGTSK